MNIYTIASARPMNWSKQKPYIICNRQSSCPSPVHAKKRLNRDTASCSCTKVRFLLLKLLYDSELRVDAEMSRINPAIAAIRSKSSRAEALDFELTLARCVRWAANEYSAPHATHSHIRTILVGVGGAGPYAVAR